MNIKEYGAITLLVLSLIAYNHIGYTYTGNNWMVVWLLSFIIASLVIWLKEQIDK